MLAALAAVNVMVVVDAARGPSFHVGIEWLAVAIVARRRNLLLGLLAAVALTAIVLAAGVR